MILGMSVLVPVFDDAEVEAGKVPGDEGLEDADGPAIVKLTVGICHLAHTHTHTITTQTKYTQMHSYTHHFHRKIHTDRHTPSCCTP